MPIYAYRCESCGFEKDVLQKMSDAPLTHCPECKGDTFRKQVTAAGFQLKGSGWYVTDFRGGSNSASGAKGASGGAGGADSGKSEAGESKAAAATESSTSTSSSSSNSSSNSAAVSSTADA